MLHFTSSPKLMGKFANNLGLQCVTWGLALLLIIINVYFVIDFISDPSNPLPTVPWQKTLFFVVIGVTGVAYIGFIAYLVSWDVRDWVWQWRVYCKGRSCRAGAKDCWRNHGGETGDTLDEPLMPDETGGR